MKQSTKEKMYMVMAGALLLASLCLESYWAAKDAVIGL